MKIATGTQQPDTAQQRVDDKAQAAAPGAAPQKTGKAGPKTDTVNFSTTIDKELINRQALQAVRVESIKSLVKAGKYQVSSLAVAEKMLSGSSKK